MISVCGFFYMVNFGNGCILIVEVVIDWEVFGGFIVFGVVLFVNICLFGLII